MHQQKSKKILIYFLLLIFVSSIGNNAINNLKFRKIENINISGLDQKNNQILLNKLNSLSLGNIFFIDKNQIENLIKLNSLIERYVIFKEYPSTINIKIEKTNFLAKINDNGKILLVGSNGKLTQLENGYSELPYIFGKPSIKEFLKLKRIIDLSQFSYNQIKNIYFFPSKRWDLNLKDNVLLKLPNNITVDTIDYLYKFLENYGVENYTIVDARLNNMIIVNEKRK